MSGQLGQISPLTAVVAASIISAVTAILVAVVTSILTRKREHEADWRKLKLAQYQEFVLALSGIVKGRATPDAQRRYADAVNSMSLVAPSQVLSALRAFQKEISYVNRNRSESEQDRLLDTLFRAMRTDIHPTRHQDEDSSDFRFWLLGIPPETVETNI